MIGALSASLIPSPSVSHSLPTGSEAGLQKTAESMREAAEQLVAQAFILPMLEQMQQDPFRNEMFHGGQGEEIFSSQWNQIIADRLTHKADFPLVDTLQKFLSRNQGPEQGMKNGSVDRTA